MSSDSTKDIAECFAAARLKTKTLREHPLIAPLLRRLAADLPRTLYYHAAPHTDDVLSEVVLFGTYDGLGEREIELLAIAAAYHDAGFLTRAQDNEVLGAWMAVEAMRAHGGYSEDEIALVERAILDTKVVGTLYGFHQIPTTELAGYLLDADLGNLGRDDFFARGELMYRELNIPRELFLINTLELMYGHRWNSPAALALRETKKQENVAELRKTLKASVVPAQQGPLQKLSRDQLEFLAGLPVLLNTAGDLKETISQVLRELDAQVDAEAATVFLLTEDEKELQFWALDSARAARLSGTTIPLQLGIVGHVMERQESVLVPDVSTDPRFFPAIDEHSGFVTRDLLCVPITARGNKKIGAIEVMNKRKGTLTVADLILVDHLAHLASLAIENAILA